MSKSTAKRPKTLPEPFEALYRIQRALAGYVSYLAACETNAAFSEYILYEPILRVLLMRRYAVKCEFAMPGIRSPSRRGDHKRIDFEAKRRRVYLSLEVKWPKTQKRTLNVQADREKLAEFHRSNPGSFSFLCVVGRYEHIKNVKLSPSDFTEVLKPRFALFGRTQFGCRVYRLNADTIR